MTDVSETLIPNSDQLDAVDLADGPQTFTIERVVVRKPKNKPGDQPMDVHLVEFPRMWRPGKNMRRVLAYCWGTDSSRWVGKRVRLYCDTNVTFGNDAVGGTRISHLSGIDGPRAAPVINGKKAGTWKVDPLPDAAPTAEPTIDARIKQLQSEWQGANPERRIEIQAEVEALRAGL